METFIIDGTNVSWWYSQAFKEEVSIKPLLSVIKAILDNEDDFYCVFDASMTEHLKKNNRVNEEIILRDLIDNFPDKFFTVTGSTKADSVILHNADTYNRRIITSDTYREYIDKYKWLENKYNDRLIQGNVQRSGLITLEKLTYGNLEINENIKDQAGEIKKKLQYKTSPEIIDLENDINEKKKILRSLNKNIEERENKLLELQISEKKYSDIVKNLMYLKSLYEEDVKPEKGKDFTLDIEKDYHEKVEKLKKINREIEEREKIFKRINSENKLIKEKELDNKECIKKAQKAIDEFLEQYGLNNTIQLNGSTWDIAVKALEISFLKKPICLDCYERSLFSYDNFCRYCSGNRVTKYPKKIWDIINEFKPNKAECYNSIETKSEKETEDSTNTQNYRINPNIFGCFPYE